MYELYRSNSDMTRGMNEETYLEQIKFLNLRIQALEKQLKEITLSKDDNA